MFLFWSSFASHQFLCWILFFLCWPNPQQILFGCWTVAQLMMHHIHIHIDCLSLYKIANKKNIFLKIDSVEKSIKNKQIFTRSFACSIYAQQSINRQNDGYFRIFKQTNNMWNICVKLILSNNRSLNVHLFCEFMRSHTELLAPKSTEKL